MPYAGISDSSLPDKVKEMPEKAKKVFVAVFNSVFEACDKGDCEGKAFAAAYAAAERAGKQQPPAEDNEATKAGRILSQSSRKKILRAVEALLDLLGTADSREADLRQAREAVDRLTEGDIDSEETLT